MTSVTIPDQSEPDYYKTLKECESKKHYKYPQTNPRYKDFNQIHFTAGDYEQFQRYRGMYNGDLCVENIPIPQNPFNSLDLNLWDGYGDLKADCVNNTFRYMFDKFKKGIFIKIVSNSLKVFLPFSKHNFTNEWYTQVLIDPKYKDFARMIEYTSNAEGRKFNSYRVNLDFSQWYGNNSLIRYEKPLSEGDSNVDNVKNLLIELCSERKIPDIEFFINRRDFPLLTRDGTEPYNHLWGTDKQPLVSHAYEKYSPILSMCITDRYADVLMPTWEDWARVQSYDSKFFSSPCKLYKYNFTTPWVNKKPTAVFRGATTGYGVTAETNPRIKVSLMSAQEKTVPGKPRYLDAGITNWNLRPRKMQGDPYLRTIEIEKIGFGLVKYMTPEEQSTYKYLINIDGHVTAYRLSLELSMGSVILLVDSPWKVWYRHMLKPMVHYVPIKHDLSDLIQQIEWCRQNDDKCEQIAKNALEFFNKYLQKSNMLDYMQKVLINLKAKMGIYVYNIQTPLDVMVEYEENSLSYYFPETRKVVTKNITFPIFMNRCSGFLQGIEFAVRKVIKDTGDFSSVSKYTMDIFSNKTGRVYLYQFGNVDCVIKVTEDAAKAKEHVHDTFVGTKCINKLCQYYPNFVYTYGMYKKKNYTCVILEYIKGMTLDRFIANDEFNMYDFLQIFVQILLSLQVAQNLYGFVHYDLAPWNIVIRSRKEIPIRSTYLINYKRAVTVSANMVPVLIDFGKSHVIYEGKHHGIINMLKMSTCQDMINLLVFSIKAIIEKWGILSNDRYRKSYLDRKSREIVYFLVNFLAGGEYLKKPFTPGNSDDELYTFLKRAGTMQSITSSNKGHLEQLAPYDFVQYILTRKNDYSINWCDVIDNPVGIRFDMNNGNGHQVFEYALAESVKQRLDSYYSCFVRVKQCTLPQPTNKLFLYYTAQSIYGNLDSVYYYMDIYIKQENIVIQQNDNMLDKIRGALEFIGNLYTNLLEKADKMENKKIEYKLPGNSNNLLKDCTESTLMDPEKILAIVSEPRESCGNIVEYKNIIEKIFVYDRTFRLTPNDREYYMKNLESLLDTNSVVLGSECVSIDFLVKKIYTENKRVFLEKVQENAGRDCSEVQKYIKLYEKILEKMI